MRKMTARSYSATTLKQMNNEIGNVIIINNAEHISAMISMHVERLPRAENSKGDKKNLRKYFVDINKVFFLHRAMTFGFQ